ncbi:hypothetical protein VNO78_10168 [Psophocarpus tetragonolobus]|uniref:Uncharacterized protein n=1 Tax=Psophocarpus tetragonolobus TaxID=3891 RepID=A0AAN9XM07_PSOTE
MEGCCIRSRNASGGVDAGDGANVFAAEKERIAKAFVEKKKGALPPPRPKKPRLEQNKAEAQVTEPEARASQPREDVLVDSTTTLEGTVILEVVVRASTSVTSSPTTTVVVVQA